jgi:rhodanese-related sulfurtransferase
MKKQLFLLALLSGMAFGYKDIGAEEVALFATTQDAVVVDVRLNEEWVETGVLANAYLITYFDAQAKALKTEFLKKLSEATKGDKTKPVVLVCRTGLRSKLVAGILDREGYKSVYNYKDGMLNWLAEKRSVIKPKK